MLEQIRQCIKGKKILILGFGKEGRSTYAYLQKAGGYRSLGVADLNPVQVDCPDVECITGPGYQEATARYDVVFKSPGIVLKHRDAATLAKLTSQTDQFLRRFGGQTVGVTGTKGKSTTASLLYHILRQTQSDCMLIGNIGIPALDMADQVGPHTQVVYELSCHQLEYAAYSPHIAVLLNVFPEHLDHYGTLERYVAAKQQIYRHQQEGDLLVCGVQCLPAPGTCRARLCSVSMDGEEADVVVTDRHTIRLAQRTLDFSGGLPHLIGKHNLYNVGMAYAVSQALGVPEDTFYQAVQSYRPLPHRLEYLGEFGGVRYYDDSISTIPETAMQALESLQDVGTLILGGMDRGISYQPLLDFLAGYDLDNLVFLPQTGHGMYQTIQRECAAAFAGKTLRCVADLREAVALAKQLTAPGKICLLSPAAASYGFFKNFEERGDYFRRYVMEADKVQ